MKKNFLIKSIFILALFFLSAASNPSPSFSASGCLTPGVTRCNENVPDWVQTCSNCDIDPENEWCNTTNCAASGQLCVNGACQTNPDCRDNDHDGYGNPGHASCPKGDALDCDDTKAAVYPGAQESCVYGSQTDNDCDGEIGCADSTCAGNTACDAPCVLTSASWQPPLNIQDGDTATLIVNGENCDGQREVKFEIWEKDVATADDFVETVASTITFSGNTAQITWPAKWECEVPTVFGLCADDPEYYFKTALTSDTSHGISSPTNNDALLKVSKPSGGTTPEITFPANGSTLSGTTQLFSWTANGANVTNWGLDLSGSGYLWCAGGTGETCVPLDNPTSITVNNLPIDGRTINATLWYSMNNGANWERKDYTYTTYAGGGGTATVSWDKVITNADGTPITDLAGYNIYYGTAPRTGTCPDGGYPFKQTINDANATSYVFNNLETGKTYYFSVTAFDTSGNESACSDEKSKAIAAPPCQLTSAAWNKTTAIEGEQVSLIVGGTNCNGQQVRFKIYEDELGTNNPLYVELPGAATFSGNAATINWTAEWFDDGFAQGDPEYYFKAELVSNANINITSSTDEEDELLVSQGGGGTATVSWNPNTESDLAGYKIYYGTSSRGSAACSTDSHGYANNVDAGNTTSYVFNNLASGNTYYFSVSAYDTSGNESCFSDEKSKTIF